MTLIEESGYCPSTGIYQSKWPSPSLPQSPSSFPCHLFSQIPPQCSTKPAFIDAATGHSLTFIDLQKLTFSAANYLHSLGIKKGDVVLLISPNSLHFPIVLLSIMSMGAVFTTTNFLHTRKEIEAQVRDSNPVLILTTQQILPKVQGLISSPPLLVESFITNSMQSSLPLVHREENTWHKPHNIAAIMYPSGTTGKSKGVALTHESLITMSCVVGHVWRMGSGDETFMCVVPLFHMFGIAVLLCGAIGIGSTVVVMAKYEISEMIEAVERYSVTKIPVAPPIVVQLLRLAGEGRKCKLSSLKEVICSGAPLGKKHLDRFRKRFPNINLSQAYGLTEGGIITLCDESESRLDASAGKLLPYVEAKMVEIDTKMALPPNKCGELHVRGPSVMQGYWRNREATSLAIDQEGWLHTGDLCFMDSSGRLHIVDRIKELIKYKAYQVAPVELEEILITHPQISDVAVISHSDEAAGEIPVACVVGRLGVNIQKDEIIHFMENKVAPYKKIRKVILVDRIPRSASGKILRKLLKASIASNQLLKITSRL